jgi:hypothetical protein
MSGCGFTTFSGPLDDEARACHVANLSLALAALVSVPIAAVAQQSFRGHFVMLTAVLSVYLWFSLRCLLPIAATAQQSFCDLLAMLSAAPSIHL